MDSIANRTQVVDTNGTTTLGYDSLYRQNAVTYPNGNTQSYTYDPMGNRLTKVNYGSTTSYTYDDADQMTAAGGVTYGYDNNGNQTSRGTDTFGYNAENWLTSTNLGGTSGSYVYNGDGLRTSRTIGGTTTAFVWGSALGMPVILQDGTGNTYLYGLALISMTNSKNKTFYYHTDGLGSTTAITSSTGAVQNTYQYDVFGAIRVQTGTQPNEFTFTGQQVDSSALEYLRARFYDNATGRFLVRDQAPDRLGSGQALNNYPYVANNPVNFVDPSGLCCPRNPEDCVPDPVKKAARNIADAISTGYIDVGVTPCYWGCITVGVQLGRHQGLHFYGGAGLGSPGIGGAVNLYPHQRIAEGWSCGVQGGIAVYPEPIAGIGVGGEFGYSGFGTKEAGFYGGAGPYVGIAGVSATCYYVLPGLFGWLS